MTHPDQPGVRALDRPDLFGTVDAVGYVATAPEFSGQAIIFAARPPDKGKIDLSYVEDSC